MVRNPKYFVIEVDGTFTDGRTIYNNDGAIKIFGRDNWSGIEEVINKIEIVLVSCDPAMSVTQFNIFQKSLPDYCKVKYPNLAIQYQWSASWESKNYLIRKLGMDNVIYFSSCWKDKELLKDACLGIVPSGLRPEIVRNANIVLTSKPGSGCVLDACIEVKKYLEWEA